MNNDIKIALFDNQIRNLIGNSGLTPGETYFIIKNCLTEISELFQQSISSSQKEQDEGIETLEIPINADQEEKPIGQD